MLYLNVREMTRWKHPDITPRDIHNIIKFSFKRYLEGELRVLSARATAQRILFDSRENRTGTECFLVSGQLPVAGTFDFRGDKIKRALLPAADRRGITARRNDRGNELRDIAVTGSAPVRSDHRAEDWKKMKWLSARISMDCQCRESLWWGRVSGIKATFADQSDRTRSICTRIDSLGLFPPSSSPLSLSLLLLPAGGCIGKFDTDQIRKWGVERAPTWAAIIERPGSLKLLSTIAAFARSACVQSDINCSVAFQNAT